MNKTALVILRLTSSLLLLGLMFTLYWVFNEYDWGHPLAKAGCFSAFFVLAAGLQYLSFHRETPALALWLEFAVLSIILITLFFFYGREYGPSALQPPWVDIGYTTVNATTLLVKQHQNPYSSSNINVRDELAPEYRGFHYGPAMMLGYLPSGYFPDSGYKIVSLFYVAISTILLVFLVTEADDTWATWLARIAFTQTAFFLPESFWREVLYQGANDVFPVMLVLAALLALKKDLFFWTGIFAGLSFAAKFSPAAFLVPFLPARQKQFWIGFAIGLAPLFPFLFWDFASVVRNVFWFRVIMRSDSTSLYSVLPVEIHWLMPVTLVIALLVSVYWNIRGTLDYRTALIGFTLLLIVADVTQKEIHLNHLIWFCPLFAIIFAYDRERLFGFISAGAH